MTRVKISWRANEPGPRTHNYLWFWQFKITSEDFYVKWNYLLISLCRLAADIRDSDPEGRACFSPLLPCPVMQSPLASCPPTGSSRRGSSMNITASPARFEPLPPRPASGVLSQADKPPSKGESANNLHQDASGAPVPNPPLDSDRGLITLAFPSTTWSSCPSSQRTTLRSGSGPNLTPSASVTRLESHRWPVLPPISPVRGEKWTLPHMDRSQPPPCLALRSCPRS